MQHQRIDLVFMDVSMPTMDGYETTQQLRQHPSSHIRHVLVIALTAHIMAGERECCLAAGMDDYLTKPFDLDALSMMLYKWLVNK